MKYLLNLQNGKTSKGEKLGFLTGVLYLAPAETSGRWNLCPSSTAGCRAGCLAFAGRVEMESPTGKIWRARNERTELLMRHRAEFLARLSKEIRALIKKAKRENLTPCVRLNGTSDLPFLPLTVCPLFPEIQFYDYTKIPIAQNDARLKLPNYHLTFSRSESNGDDVARAIEQGVNVAVPFDIQRGKPLPSTWNEYTVIDGDISDLRFKDVRASRGVIVGLRSKGNAHRKLQSRNNNPFIVKL